MRTSIFDALVTAMILVATVQTAAAQEGPRPEICAKLVANGIPKSTARAFYDDVRQRVGQNAMSEDLVHNVEDALSGLPLPLVVGVVEVGGRDFPETGEIGKLNWRPLRFLVSSSSTESVFDEILEVEQTTNEVDVRFTEYRMTIVRDIRYEADGFTEKPDQTRADGGRWDAISLDGNARFKLPDGESFRSLAGNLRIVAAGIPRPPYLTETVEPWGAVCETCDGNIRVKTVHLEPVCAAIVNARTGKELYVIQ